MADQKAYRKRLKALMNKPENTTCADCDEKQPRWASLIKAPPGSPFGNQKLGVFMCLECSGSHRRLGVHITFVRSINLDSWKEEEVIAMENGGNGRVNSMFEAHLARSGIVKPNNQANGFTRERFIRDKYERRKFYDPAGIEDYDEEEIEEEVAAPVRQATRTVKMPTAMVRAPSEAAKRRAESRQARLAGQAAPNKPGRIDGAKAPAPAAPASAAPAPDLLDFASFPASSSTPAPAPVAPQKNETLDLFANMAATTPTAAPSTSQTSNDQIMSLFNTPQANPMGGMVAGGSVMMGGQQMNPMMMQQMMMQQQQMMIQQQRQQQANMMQPQFSMMHNMMQQQQPNMMQQQQAPLGGAPMGGAMQGNMMQNPRAMMAQNGGMIPQQSVMQGNGMTPMGTGPAMATMQGGAPSVQQPQQAQKEDPFAQFGFNAFR